MKIFTESELEVKYRTQLYKIARDLELDITRKTKKGELIEKLLEYTPVEELEELPSMSVQVRRIYESSKGE